MAIKHNNFSISNKISDKIKFLLDFASVKDVNEGTNWIYGNEFLTTETLHYEFINELEAKKYLVKREDIEV